MKDFIFSDQGSLFGNRTVVGFGNLEFYVKEIDRNNAIELIKANHYSKKVYAGSYIHLGVFMGGVLVGVLQFGAALNPNSASSVVGNTNADEYLELNRMWLADIAPKNSESMAIAYSIKFIKKKFPKIKWIQSFADERCGRYGVVYQAANFNYYGEHDSIFWTLDDEVYHNIQMTISPTDAKRYNKTVKHLQDNRDRAISQSLRQFRYLYFIDKRERKNCLLKEVAYPKHPALPILTLTPTP